MSLSMRKILVAFSLLFVIVLANANAIVGWLADVGLVTWAGAIRSEYLTGTAIVGIVAVLGLLGEPSVGHVWPWRWRAPGGCAGLGSRGAGGQPVAGAPWLGDCHIGRNDRCGLRHQCGGHTG